MAKKRTTDAAVDTVTVADNQATTLDTAPEVTAMDVSDETTTVTLDADNMVQGRFPLDMLDDACPSKELRARFSDDERKMLRDLFRQGRLTREVRAIEMSGGKNPTGVDQLQPYWAYVPVFEIVSQDDGRVIVDATAAYYLSNQKLAYHFDWKEHNQKAETPEQEAQKLLDEQWGVASHYDHGLDLKVRQNVRAHLSGELLGPVAEIAKGVRSMFVNDIAESKQDAFDMVVSKRKARGMPVPENLTLESLGIVWPKGK